MSQPAFIETVMRFQQKDGSQFRFWAEIPFLNSGRQELVDAIIDGFKSLPDKDSRTSDDLAMELMQFHSSITAVEVVDPHGNGVVLYAQWP